MLLFHRSLSGAAVYCVLFRKSLSGAKVCCVFVPQVSIRSSSMLCFLVLQVSIGVAVCCIIDSSSLSGAAVCCVIVPQVSIRSSNMGMLCYCSNRILIFQYSDSYRTKLQLLEYQTNIPIGLQLSN